MRHALVGALAALAVPVMVAAQETPRFQVVSEYIGQLVRMQDIYDTSARELKEVKDSEGPTGKLVTGIRGSTRIRLELGRSTAAFKSMRLGGDFASLLPTVVNYYEKKSELHEQLIDISTQLMSGPKPGVDYGKLSASAPQIRATLQYIDQSLFEATPMFCLLLVDEKPDSKGHVSHLVITKAERRQLISRINRAFATHLREKNPNYTVSSALLIRDFLAGGHKSSDEPWE